MVAVQTTLGRIECDTLVNATGMWGTETARLAGVDLAVNAVEHQYVVTEKTDLPRDLPTFRDPDARIYLKPEAGSLVIGGWEMGTRAPWRRIPLDLGPDLFAPNHERFAPLAEAAAHRVPLFGSLGIQTWVNGPIPFSPDAEPLMGVTEDLDNLFHCCGFSAGIAAAGGAGYAIANWIIDGDPGLDLWPFDVRRFGAPHNVAAYLEARSIDAYGHYYEVAYPNRELESPRGQRRSAVYERLRAAGAIFGTKFGWERANWFTPVDGPVAEIASFGRSNAFEFVAAEHHAVRTAVGVVDQSSFAKYEISGTGALALLQKVAGGNLDVAIGRIVYTQLLNATGGIEADVTITRLDIDRFYFVTGSAFGRHDLTFLLQHAQGAPVHIQEVTSAYGVLNVCGPQSRDLLMELTTADLSNSAFPYMTARRIDVGLAPVRALRATYVGELGWELHVPTEYMADLYDRIIAAGAVNVGYRAVESLRLEKHYVAWAARRAHRHQSIRGGARICGEARQAGAAGRPRAAVDSRPRSSGSGCSGSMPTRRSSCMAASCSRTRRCRWPPPCAVPGYGHTVGRSIFSAYVPVELADEVDFIVDVATVRHPARRHDRPLYDPDGSAIRS